ncbi:MAG: nuclear transport factor 2 family protein [Devosia sp.]
MAVTLPRIIETYFAADRDGSPDAVIACFTPDASVTDEGETHVGHEAIRSWKTGAAKKYSYTAEPVLIAVEDGRTVVTSHLVGDFPGSPVDLRYFFVLSGERIAQLEITI